MSKSRRKMLNRILNENTYEPTKTHSVRKKYGVVKDVKSFLLDSSGQPMDFMHPYGYNAVTQSGDRIIVTTNPDASVYTMVYRGGRFLVDDTNTLKSYPNLKILDKRLSH